MGYRVKRKGKGQNMDDFIIRNIDIADGSGKEIYKGITLATYTQI